MAFCSNCGTQYNEGARFCPGCSASIVAQPTNPGEAPPPQPTPYSGYAIPPQQVPYPIYAPPPLPMAYNNIQVQQRYGGKSKTRALILALLFSYWTWLYTFKRDRIKFFIALILALAAFAGYYVISRFSYFSLAVSLILWVWPLVDTLRKRPEWYAGY
jgi:hypothetical protein